MSPLNDLAKIDVDGDGFNFAGADKDTFESGILVELPKSFSYFGFWSFAFENSLMNKKTLEDLHKHYTSLIGKRVYWTALSEKGNVLKDPESGKNFAFVKLTSLIAESKADYGADNLHSDGAGSFSV